MSERQVYVSVMLGAESILVGKLWCRRNANGRESASFEYEQSWLAHPERFEIDPALPLTEGVFHTEPTQQIFGVMGDSAPDRWGRVLMTRSERLRAEENGDTPRSLAEVDYLVGVNDEARQGALRYSDEIGGPFLSPEDETSIPPLVDLPSLLSASERFIDEDETAQDLKLLLVPGTSLGGARPKASVRDQDGSLAIAKFPRKDDEHKVVLWEAVALTLAAKAGIRVPDWRVENIAGKSVLILNRFDREGEIRIPFLSAMSMLGARDNEDQHSYLDIAYALIQHGGRTNDDLAELWRRIVFTILISNTDDHLRNHGFVYERGAGWRLSPVYDINPTPTSDKLRILSTAINYNDHTASLDIALSVIDEFRLSSEQAREIISEVAGAVTGWRDVAERVGLRNLDIERMASAFEHQDLEKAINLA